MADFSFTNRGEGLGPPPAPFRVGQGGRRSNRPWLPFLAVALALFIGGGILKSFYVEWLWFESVGYASVFLTTLSARVALFAVAAVAFLVFFLGNLLIARALSPQAQVALAGGEAQSLGRALQLTVLGSGLLLAFIFGSVAMGQWAQVLRLIEATPFGMQDPIFGQDIGFFVFALPVQSFLQTWGTSALVVTLLAVVVVYGVTLSLRYRGPAARAARAHIAVLGIAIILLQAFGYWLDRYELLYSPGGVAFGPGYTELNARLPVLNLLIGAAVVTAVLLATTVVGRGLALPTLGLVAWGIIAVLGGGLYPEFVQRFQVEPNELAMERPYIENNIRFTRQAFGLDQIEEKLYPGEDMPTQQDIARNPETMRSIRLWDHEPLKATYDQIQSIRRYYDFHDVDIDRYTFGGEYRQVMLSARELAPEKLALAGEALTWVNQRLKFTHGYGITLSPVNEISGEGLPNLLVKNLPPVSSPPIPAFEVKRPEIYFGEETADWAIVNSNEEELDYASETEIKYTRYAGTGGVLLDSLLKKVVFAWEMSDPNILLTNLRPESRILYIRNVQDRVRHVAPFLLLDRDPYVVIADGRLKYMQDAYTTTNRYPYSEPYRLQFNYIRNSVKAVVDAYDGTVDFYIADPADPLIRTYDRIFPGLFKPLDQMPANLRAHMRYPEDLFNIQAATYQNYHMQDPQVFYNKEDAYTRPIEIYLDKERPMDAYYVVMRLPGEQRPEFVLILPFTPVNKNNTNAWLAGRSDGEHYGKLLAFSFPKEKLIFGPRQIESRIDQDPAISAQFALWNQSGSRVLRGNLLFIPIEQSYVYVEPIYLQSEKSQLPELKRVVVAAGNRIAMEPTLEESLNKVYGAQVLRPPAAAPGAPATPPGGAPAPQPTTGQPTTGQPTLLPPATATLVGLAREAQDQFTRAQDRLKAGDWAGYGVALQQLEGTLKRMAEAPPQ